MEAGQAYVSPEILDTLPDVREIVAGQVHDQLMKDPHGKGKALAIGSGRDQLATGERPAGSGVVSPEITLALVEAAMKSIPDELFKRPDILHTEDEMQKRKEDGE